MQFPVVGSLEDVLERRGPGSGVLFLANVGCEVPQHTTEMAQAALYLASDESSFVTGTEFTVDGGITAAYVTPE